MILDGLAYLVLCLLVAAGVFSLHLGYKKDSELFVILITAFILVALALWRLIG